MTAGIIEAVNGARAARRPVATVTDLSSGAMRMVLPETIAGDRLEPALADAFRTGKSCQAEDGRQFINVYLPAPRIVAVGAVHITQALAALAPVCGFALSVVDPRSGFATPERFAGVDLLVDWPEDAFAAQPLDEFTALAAVSHDPGMDDPALIAALKARCFYIGALGSRRSHAQRVERLSAAGVSDEDLGLIHAPIGVDIAAATPQEIAVAILAEIIAALRRPDRAATGRIAAQAPRARAACLVDG
ncbi:XdhC/CoxF family protein [Rhizobium rhizosphaerae]|uniref:XdhC/CoxF family protein n=1 Tax=Xaviernesmea rhizosphaerae TaxID=1672749 RepID=A0ABX3PIZ1_9HYPH|nr:XdhC family protein [Xaviernesmea rhizosphaerae]OQP88096.1 XdhC/CoxF family protein [Xaviernesmea rhizosphaerae]